MISITKDSPLKMVRSLGEACRKCGSCCSHGTGFLVPDDIPRIAKFLNITEDKLKELYLEEKDMFNTKAWKPKTIKKPFGPCVFYEKKEGCTIHIAKPFQCMITNCGPYSEQAIQWLYLNYFVNSDDPESVRQWASYLKHKEWVIEGGNRDDIVPDKVRLKKILGYDIVK